MTAIEDRAAETLKGMDRESLRAERLLREVQIDLHTEPPAQHCIVERIVPAGVVTICGAHGGAGKSLLGLTLNAHAAVGRTWAGFGIEKCKSLYVSLEDPGSLVAYRLHRIVDAYQLDSGEVLKNLTILDGSDSDSAMAIEAAEHGPAQLMRTAALEELEALASGCGLIVVDNASDAYAANENNRRQVRQFMRWLTGIARANSAGLLLLVHVDKAAARFGAGGNSYSGSTAWHNSARSRISLTTGKDGTVELRHEKFNLTRQADPVTLRWSDAGVLVPAGKAPQPSEEDVARVDAIDDTSVLEATRAAVAAGVQVPNARSGPATTQRTLETFPELSPHLHGTKGRKRFWFAVGRLTQSGKLVTEEQWSPSRHKRVCIVPLESSQVPIAINHPLIPPRGTGETRDAVSPVIAPIAGSQELAQTRETREVSQCTAAEYRRASEGGRC